MTKKNARKGRSDGKKNFLDQLINCGRVERLLAATLPEKRGDGEGTGIALRNVAERIERFYGPGSGIEIMSKLGEGTVVTLRLADSAPDSPATPS